MSSEQSATTKRRVRSEAQLNQKRLVDRVKHRENRQEQKLRMERMEAEILGIRKSLEEISSRLQATPQQAPDLFATQRVPQPVAINKRVHGSGSGFDMFRSASDTQPQPQSQSQSRTTRESSVQSASFQSTTSGPTPPTGSEPVSLPLPTPPMVDCRCGVQHSSQADCLEYCSFTILYETHAAFPHDPYLTRSLPRNPTLSEILFRADTGNPVALFLTTFVREFKLTSVETLFGCYFFAYRLMRWRLNPDPNSLEDVPSWLLPTEVQKTVPHPVSVDYIPWPALRDRLCRHQQSDLRHSVKLYLESLRLKWPPGCSLLALDERGQPIVSPDLERIACDLANWELGSPWSEMFPHLVKHVHP